MKHCVFHIRIGTTDGEYRFSYESSQFFVPSHGQWFRFGMESVQRSEDGYENKENGLNGIENNVCVNEISM